MSQKTFRYQGLMYVRPIGRGIRLGKELADLEETIGLEDGWYKAKLTLEYERCDGPPEDPLET